MTRIYLEAPNAGPVLGIAVDRNSEPLGSCKNQVEKSIVAYWVQCAISGHPSPGITEGKRRPRSISRDSVPTTGTTIMLRSL